MVFDSTGIEYALVALFIVLTIEQLKALGDSVPMWIGAAAAGIAMLLLPPAHQLIGAIAIVTVALLVQYRRIRTSQAGKEARHV